MVKIGLGISADRSFTEAYAIAAGAEKFRFDSLWYPEEFLWRDAFCSLSAIAARTSKIHIGTAVVSPYTRNLALLAMSIRTLDEISEHRLMVGIGSGTRFWKTLGIRDKRPISTLRTSVRLLRNLLNAKQVTFTKESLTLNKARMGFPGRRQVPIYLGPIGPNMLVLAGAVGDGAILSEGASPGYARYASRMIRKGLSLSKKSEKHFDMASYIICWKEGRGQIRRRVSESVAAMLSVPGREILFREENDKDHRIAELRKWYWAGNLKRAGEQVDEEMLKSMTIFGRKREILRQVEQYLSAEVTHLIFSPVGYGPKELMNIFSSLKS